MIKNLPLLLWGCMVSDTGSRVQLIVIPLYIPDIGGSAAIVGLFISKLSPSGNMPAIYTAL